MGRIHEIIIPGWRQSGKIVGEPVSFNEQNVLRIHRANGIRDLYVQTFQGSSTGEVPVGFVQNVVARYPLFVGVALGQSPPQRDHFSAVGGAFPQRRFVGVVVGDALVVALPAGSGVEVQNDVHLILRTPGDQTVGQFEARIQPGLLSGHRFFLDGQRVQIVVHRQAHGIEPPGLQRIDVGAGNVIGQPGLVKFLGRRFADQFLNFRPNLMLRIGERSRLQHVSFLHHPSTKTHPAQQNGILVFVDNSFSIRAQKMLPQGFHRATERGAKNCQ